MMFPRCGLSADEIATCYGMTRVEAAKRLGINYKHFCAVVKQINIGHLFSGRNRYRHKTAAMPDAGITLEDIAECHGMLKIDAAEMLGVSASHLGRVVKKHNLGHLFPARGGEARYLAERGYAG